MPLSNYCSSHIFSPSLFKLFNSPLHHFQYLNFPGLQSIPAVRSVPNDGNTSFRLPTATVTAPIRPVCKAAAGSKVKMQAASEFNQGWHLGVHNTTYLPPPKKRKLFIQDANTQVVQNRTMDRRPSPNERISANRRYAGIGAPLKPFIGRHNVISKPLATLRPSGYHLQPTLPSNEIIEISSDEEDNARLVWANYKQAPIGGIRPTDSHQDNIIVNSIEAPDYGSPAGASHYTDCLSKQDSYKNISVDFNNYRTNGKSLQALPDLDRYKDTYPSIDRDSTIDYTEHPKSHHPADNPWPIFRGSTKNPLVCLAIIRAAQLNLPTVNFDSALSHLTNLKPTDPFPQLPQDSKFVDDVAYEAHPEDEVIRIIFIPEYYVDGRHALGYHVRGSLEDPTLLFTPCTLGDITRLGLFKVLPDDDGSWETTVVAANEGHWYDKESLTSWNLLHDWVAVSWVEKVRLMQGGEEDPN